MEKLEEIKEKAELCLNCPTRPCTKGCPLGNNIPDFIKCVKEGNYKEAYNVLLKTTVLQPICGRICPHNMQCQGNCVRGIKGKPVAIGDLEAFIGDMAIKEGYEIKAESNYNKNKKIAVIGSGPAGLTCAAFLARKGYDVTIIEKHNKLGGLLRHGIPKFRLNRDMLDAQIQKILDIGIKVIYNKELGKDYDLEQLQNNYSAVFLGIGANISRKMNIPGENLQGVFGGNELLEDNLHPSYDGKKVAVIGGGNVAMDVSRTIKRLGANKVYVIYRRAEEQMPADKKEIAAAKDEGIEFLFQNNIVRINGRDVLHKKDFSKDEGACVSNIECVKTELVKKEESDRLAPINIKDSNYILDMDYIITAVGSEVEKDIISNFGVRLNKWGYIDVDENFATSIPGVFAGGDLIGTKSTVVWAARNGRDAADAIDRFLQ